jgi:hypothetical protein
MAALAKLNTERCREVARIETMSLSEAADHLVGLGWNVYSDRLVDNTHSSRKLGRELRRIRKQRDEVTHRKVAA